MLEHGEIFYLIEKKKIVEEAVSNILATEISDQIIIREFIEGSQKYRLRTTNYGTACLEFLHTFNLNIPSVALSKSINFYKPIGIYYFHQPMKPRFFIASEFEEVAINQDSFKIEKKLLNIIYDKQTLAKALAATFSAENKLVLNCLFDLASENKTQDKIFSLDSAFLTKRYNYVLNLNKVKLRYVSTIDSSMIQVYLTDEFDIKIPLAALIEKNTIKVAPNFKDEFRILNEQGVLSYNQI